MTGQLVSEEADNSRARAPALERHAREDPASSDKLARQEPPVKSVMRTRESFQDLALESGIYPLRPPGEVILIPV